MNMVKNKEIHPCLITGTFEAFVQNTQNSSKLYFQ